ncbi:TMV resistance protein N-like [Pyrus ussuriensis x Pyrus communis]|uniref:TMV resistance protein N-like n=1 Tax=Pyrus ussuriensis x Pyrus communis TaxID=2448454 RepID=A0A5N5F781_9ROSA|nr:disease resistance protein RPV1-like [Pyrus x bretschneideri]XP_048446604.1 disease resistance protein RPV1-like [Pyrus x bretschneideri]XP_048446605.1 disease resistance protein RPV1-like [Pyrus x bretschneideri]KAB2598623.1 TMV resistance protein N-like [Pyrus ussuriensis x Pyrus communis]
MAASSSSSWKYDVFLNFRGEDTRKIFVGHLYSALRRKAINTFIDAEELRKGNDLSELLAAIESSRLSIVVFSPDYASSTWCLKELVKILACMDAKKQIVVPIFYQVDPSEVRKLKRSFAEALPQNEGESSAEMKEVESWRSALTRAANLSGWDSRKYEDDAKLIEEIVDDIFKRLIQVSSSKDNGLIGMDSHMRKIHLLLYPDPPGLHKDDVRIVGIWGMGGLGKTTAASAVYHEIAREFEACCFLENVKEGFKNNGKLHMQTQLLASISNNKVVSSDISNKGFEAMLKSLGQRKVLIVVDDVDKLDQIDALLGKQHSFGGGSRIIMTTRDSTLLSEADATYKPEIFSDSEALELFRKHAFRTIQPTRNYGQLSRRVIQYAQGLPLALKVLGAHLHNKTVRQWEDVLEKIRKIPQRGIHDVLKTSFDGLDETEKKIFLDIACFFKGVKKDYATAILDSFGFYPHDGIGVLIDRALISVSEWGKLEMHDLLEEMGREIVRQEFIEEPGRRSRLWSYEDVRHVLTQNTATEAVEGIILDSAIFKEGCSNTEAFVSMTKLRLLMIRDGAYTYTQYFDEYGFVSKVSFDSQTSSEAEDELAFGDSFDHQAPHDCFIKRWIADLKFQCSQLRCLIWRGCPLKSWPSNFQFKNLVNLDMSNSCIEQLWKGAEPLEKLKFINLSHCQYLKKTPDFTKATSLEELNLEGCTSLSEVDLSISALKNLAILNLRDCKQLKSLPSIIHMGSLQPLDLSSCSNLEMFPEISEVMKKLSKLYLDGTAIKELPSSINKLTGLTILDLRGCRELKSLPSSIHMGSLQTFKLSGCSNLEKFPDSSDVMENLSELYLDGTAIKELPLSINKLTGLTVLDLSGFQELKSLPSSIQMGSLQTLRLSGCTNFEKFPDISDVMEKLSQLYLDGTAIKELPSSINKLTGLTVLDLRGCRELKSLPSSIHMGSLRTLNFSGCSNLEKFPEISEVMEELSKLYLDWTAIKELPSSINKLTGLTILGLRGCRELKSLPSSIHMGSLQTFRLSGCSNLEKFPDISDVMEKLSKLYLDGTAIKELPSSINKLTGLTVLDLYGCQELKSLPSSIHMGSLQTLRLSGCSNLEKFPDISDVMGNLSRLHLDSTAIKELPSSINKLTGLSVLDLSWCQELKSLPSSIYMGSLQTLNLSGCSNLEELPEILDIIENLSGLCLDGTAIKELPSSINKLMGHIVLNLSGCQELKSLTSIIHMGSLQTLYLCGCSNFEEFPDISDVMEKLSNLYLGGTAIKELPSSINKLTGLTVLDLSGCRKLKSLPSSIHMGSLLTLNLSGCSNLEKFPDISDVMGKLSQLYLDGTAIKELPSSINKLMGLTHLDLSGCQELNSLPSSIHMGSLRTLDLSGCSNLEKFPEISDSMENLSELYLDGTAIKELPSSINKLTGLTVLDLFGCQELKSLPSSIHMGSLQTLNLSGCSNLEKFPEISDAMENLSELYLDGTAIKELPLSISKLTGLTVLEIFQRLLR